MAAGLKNPVAAPVTPARAASIHTSAEPVMSSAAIAPWLADPDGVRGDHDRSPRDPVGHHAAHQHARDDGSPRGCQHEPHLDAEPPTSSTANASATATMRSPNTDTPWPANSRRKSRRRKDVAGRQRR